MITTSTIYKNTRNVNENTNKLDAAMEVAAFLEQMGAFAFEHWIDAEVVYGPVIEKFYVTMKLMFPKKMPPDLAVIERLCNLDCIVTLEEDTYKRVVHVREKSDNDIHGMRTYSGFQKKLCEHKVWIIDMKIPQRFLSLDGNTVYNIDGDDILYSDIEAIYDEDVQNSSEDTSESESSSGFDF